MNASSPRFFLPTHRADGEQTAGGRHFASFLERLAQIGQARGAVESHAEWAVAHFLQRFEVLDALLAILVDADLGLTCAGGLSVGIFVHFFTKLRFGNSENKG